MKDRAVVGQPAFWEKLYREGGDGWELGEPAPALVEFIETSPPAPGRVAVPGCGRGHDARYLASRGYEAVGFDFAHDAIRDARRLAERERSTARFEQRDLFGLGAEYANAFDGIWEYTCFCAIDPARRAEYARLLASILRAGGWLLACFYPVCRGAGGPPFPMSRTEVRRLFEPSFRFERTFMPIHSVRRRAGQEWMVVARKTA
jgi:SAM-dependent methyltransferase